MKKIIFTSVMMLLSLSFMNAQQEEGIAPPCITGPSTIEVGSTYT